MPSLVGAEMVVKELSAGEEVSSANRLDSAYTPEGNLPDLLATQTAVPADVSTQPYDSVSPAPSETVSTSIVVQAEATALSPASTGNGNVPGAGCAPAS